jgi:hypothetical protein
MVVMFSADKYPRLSNLLLACFMLKLQLGYFLAPERKSAFSATVLNFMEHLMSEMHVSFEVYEHYSFVLFNFQFLGLFRESNCLRNHSNRYSDARF